MLLLSVSGWSDASCLAVPLTSAWPLMTPRTLYWPQHPGTPPPLPMAQDSISAHSRAVSPCPSNAIRCQSPAPWADVSAHLHPHGDAQ